MLQLEVTVAGERSAALAGAPIEVRSALQRTSSATVSPTLAGRTIDTSAPARPAAEDAPDWPPPDVEAAMSAEAAERDGGSGRAAPSRRAREAAETLDGGPLPSIDELMSQVPAPVLEQLEELFRAKFQTVKRVPAAVLKSYQDERKAGTATAEDEAAPTETTDLEDDSESDD